MSQHLKSFNLLLLGVIVSMNFAIAQQTEEGKEIIIIEKIIDSDGNVISKSTKRYNGKYSEKEIQQLIDEDLPIEGEYDLKGLGFGENLRGLYDIPDRRPTIGVNILFENGTAIVEKVNAGSGASKADIRPGDKIISIDGVAIASIEDIYEILEMKSKGDEVTLMIFRDGSDLEKEVVLGSGTVSGMLFNFPEDGGSSIFGDFFSLDLDSLFQELRFNDGTNEMPGMDFSPQDEKADERPSLGIFIDDEQPEIIVAEVIKDSPAEKAGLKKGDVIRRMDDNLVTSFQEIKAIMNTKRKGDVLILEIDRNKETSEIKVQLD